MENLDAIRLHLKRVLVVAHPDDESLFAAGLLIRYPGDWTVVCCSIPYNEPLRAWKFFTACNLLGAKGQLLPWAETRNAPIEHLELLSPVLNGADLVVTHGAVGEYGHMGHISVHNHVAKHFSEKALFIGYHRGGKDGRLPLVLTDIEWAKKLRAIRAYDQPMRWGGNDTTASEALLAQYEITHGGCFDLQRESYT